MAENKQGKSFFSFIWPFLILATIIAVTVMFNLAVIDLRYQELDNTLYKIAYQQDINKSLSMLSKVSILKRRLEKGTETAEEYALESKIMAVISSDLLTQPNTVESKFQYMRPVARLGLNAIRLVMGKSIESEVGKEEDNKELEVAYFYERNRRYDKALEMYAAILKAKKHTPVMRAVIELHKGFCEGMLADFTSARRSLEGVIAENPNSDEAAVAWRLIDFMNTIDDERTASYAAGSSTTLEYGKKLYLLMDYRKAIAVFAELSAKLKVTDELAEALFLKGRSHEELGDPYLAIEAYREVISKYGRSSFAQEANRRIYILGEFYERDKEITNIALTKLKEYRDEGFFDELSTYSGIVEESKITDDVRLKQREEVKKAIAGRGGDVLDVIDKLDLSGEKAVAESLKVEEERLAKASLKKKKEQAAADEIEKSALDVNEHPMRRPSYLGREIKRRAVVLQNIYNGMLKRGEDFSGTIKFQFYIERDGSVTRVTIDPSSDLVNATFNQRALEQVQQWKFPAIEEGYPAQKVIYPIIFQKGD